VGKFAASIEHLKPKVLQLQEAPDQGPRWGLCPQTPVISSRYRARHGTVPPRCCGLEPPLIMRRENV